MTLMPFSFWFNAWPGPERRSQSLQPLRLSKPVELWIMEILPWSLRFLQHHEI
jgi:hypothetical protein